ncbi:MAG: hypothetical protein GY839_03290, partial [candidate division Zixibacteria bacterium]|nr:hypothetical protein [candidate division Zixibacteria bacterium]
QAGADSIDIKITTEDLWTTIFGVSSEGGGGLYKLSVYADEKNIAGLGIGVETDVQFTTDDNDGYSFHLFDYRFLGTRNVADLKLKDFNLEDELELTLFRPFYSVDARWSYSIQYFGQQLMPRLFSQGEKYFQYKTDYTYWALIGTRAFGRYTRLLPNIQFTYRKSDYTELRDYPDIGIIPDDETISGPGLGLKLSTFRYKTATYLDEFGTTEDLTEHAFISANVLRSSSEFGADYEATLVSLETGFFFQPVSGVYTGFKNSYTHNYIGDLKR